MKSHSKVSHARSVLSHYDFTAHAGPYLIGIDPGLNGTGLAAFCEGELIKTHTFTPRKNDVWWVRAEEVADIVCEWITDLIGQSDSRTVVVIECPAHFGSVASSMGFKTGDLIKLTYLAGLIHGRLAEVALSLGLASLTIRTVPVTPGEWKGQLPKPSVIHRCRKILGWVGVDELPVKTHAWDAVGIGLWAMGKF